MKKRVQYFYDKIVSGELNEKKVARLKYDYKINENLNDFIDLATAMEYFRYFSYHKNDQNS